MTPIKDIKPTDKLHCCLECGGKGSLGTGPNVRMCPSCKGVGVKKA